MHNQIPLTEKCSPSAGLNYAKRRKELSDVLLGMLTIITEELAESGVGVIGNLLRYVSTAIMAN